MFEKHYRSMNEQLVPDEALINKILELKKDKIKVPQPKGRSFRKQLVAAATLLICIFTIMPALAANVPGIYETMYLLSPVTAQFFIPVQESCEDNGIKMEVVATSIHGNTAEIYVALQDLTGDRVDETTDLYDSYSIHRPFDSTAYCQLVSYDEATKTATFLITITEWGNHKIEGSKLTFSVRNFISGKHEYEGVPLLVDLSKVNSGHETKTVEINGGGGLNYEKYRPLNDGATVLVPSDGIVSPVEGIEITGIGYVDGKLHIQTRVKDLLQNDNHAYFFLKDMDGNERLYDYSVRFIEYTEPGNKNTRVDFDEFIFDISQHEMAEYTLHGSFYTSGLYTEGKWQVTFPLYASEETKSVTDGY